MHQKNNEILESTSLLLDNPSLHHTSQEQAFPSPDFAIAFDIDGVLVRGKIPITGGKKALELLKRYKIPFIMLTNGGGHTEGIHSKQVSERIGAEIKEDQFVQSHTPFKSVIGQYSGEWVLVLGGSKDQIRDLSASYGLDPQKVLTTSDIQKQHPLINPFPELTSAHHSTHGRIQEEFTAEDRIAAVFVFSSPRDWCLDIQVCLDLLLSRGGVLGTRSAKNGDARLPGRGYQQDGQPRLYFCNPDFEWATQYHLPRLAQGGFRAALEGVWLRATEGQAGLRAWTCGKPTSTTYRYAERVLEENHRRAVSDRDDGAGGAGAGAAAKLRRVYMIGDNPKSDICGALAADEESHLEWRSVLVETGVYEAGTVPEYLPTVFKENVLEAVEWVLREEMGHGVEI